MDTKDGWSLVSLAVLAAALLLVGVVSGTPLRRAVQVVPSVLLFVVEVVRRPRSWAAAALAIELFWLTIFIWLYLMGVARITGHFSSSEVALTIVIGVAAAGGIFVALRSQRATWPARITAFLISGIIQVGAMWLSTPINKYDDVLRRSASRVTIGSCREVVRSLSSSLQPRGPSWKWRPASIRHRIGM